MAEETTTSKQQIDYSVFYGYFPEGEIQEIAVGDVSENALSHFKTKYTKFVSPGHSELKHFDRFFILNHADGRKTYFAQQTKTNGDSTKIIKLAYFVDVDRDDDRTIGRSELRYYTKCRKENEEYFINKPFISWISAEAGESGIRSEINRIFMMNAYSQMMYGLPLYSDTLIAEDVKKIWEKLAMQGKAKKFKEGKKDRYVLQIEKIIKKDPTEEQE